VVSSTAVLERLTVPFLITGPVQERTEAEVWHGEWGLPFPIYPLGSPRKMLAKTEFLRDLPSLKNEKQWSVKLRLSGTFAFVPAQLTSDDWAILIERLAGD
jgi:hypothetical protein